MKKEINVLIADDETSIATLIRTVVERDGYTAVTVSNGRDAILELQKNHFDIVLCDESMPYCRGSEVASWMRDHEATRQIPFILITAEQDSVLFADLLTSGKISSYLAKPFSISSITHLIKIFLHTSQLNSRINTKVS